MHYYLLTYQVDQRSASTRNQQIEIIHEYIPIHQIFFLKISKHNLHDSIGKFHMKSPKSFLYPGYALTLNFIIKIMRFTVTSPDNFCQLHRKTYKIHTLHPNLPARNGYSSSNVTKNRIQLLSKLHVRMNYLAYWPLLPAPDMDRNKATFAYDTQPPIYWHNTRFLCHPTAPVTFRHSN